MMFQGVFTALITPFKNGAVDFQSLEKLIDDQIQAGIQGFVVCGTTGESVTLTEDESFSILQFVCDKVSGRIPILFGSGSNNTHKTIQLSQKACELPIDGLLTVVPYYNKPPQEGLIAHFSKIADEVSKPIVLYNVPGRTGISLSPESIIELAKHPNIVGIKEADGDMNNFSKYKSHVPQDFCLLSGDDESSVSFCLLGGHGVISVCSHIAPGPMVQWIQRGRDKDESVRDEFRGQNRWIQSLYLTANPIPVKNALVHKKIIESDEMRLPLVPLNKKLEDEMLLAFRDFPELLK